MFFRQKRLEWRTTKNFLATTSLTRTEPWVLRNMSLWSLFFPLQLKINELIASMISEEFHNIKGFRRNVYDLQKEQLVCCLLSSAVEPSLLQFPMTSSETIAIITMFRERVKDEPALVTPCGEYIVIADLHGLYRDTVLMLAHGEYPFSKPMWVVVLST